MELWIRSQDRTVFTKCKHISVEEIVTVNKKSTKWCVVINFGCVGEYGTKERCLEIIDEIQRKLSVSTTLEFDKGNNIKYRQNNVIYNMPKE